MNRTVTRRLRLGLWMLVAVASSVLLACSPSTPRELPFPILDPKAPFPEQAPAQAGGPATAEGADDEIARMMRESGAANPAGQPSAAIQTLLVAGRFVAELPLRFEEWRWATDGDVTLAVHFSEGRPDALIYAEAFGPMVRGRPTEELQRFLGTIDPGLLSPGTIFGSLVGLATRGILATVGAESVEYTFAEVAGLAQGLWAAMSRTGGNGFGYRSTDHSFSGWRWVGRSEYGLAFRLARTAGTWGEQRGGFASLAGEVISRLEFLRPIKDFFDRPIAAAGPGTRPHAEPAAWMVLGNVVLRDEIGAHLAFLCAQEPVCSVTPDFVNFLETLRSPSRAAAQMAEGSGAATSLPELAEAARMRLAPKDILLGSDVLVRLAKEISEKAKEDAGTSGRQDPAASAQGEADPAAQAPMPEADTETQ